MASDDHTLQYLMKNEMENGCFYECISEEFSIGIWYDNKMYGISNKFKNELILSEYHCDCGLENCKLCKPIKKISEPMIIILDKNDFDNVNFQCSLYKVLFFIEKYLGLH